MCVSVGRDSDFKTYSRRLVVPRAAATLDGSADGVSEVEQAAFLLAGGVDLYIVRLDGTAAADDLWQHAQELYVGIGFFEKLEELLVTDAAELHGFAHAIVQVFSGKGLCHAGVDIDGARLIEGADEILARRDVERDLAADGAADLREHGCRELDVCDAAVTTRPPSAMSTPSEGRPKSTSAP